MKERYSSFIPPSNPHLCPIPRAQREVHVLGIAMVRLEGDEIGVRWGAGIGAMWFLT